MKAGINISGVEGLQKDLDRLAKKFSKDVVDAAITGGQLIRTEAIKSIQEVSHGETVTRYREGGNSYEHVASVEGEAPNTDTWRLVQSIQVDVTKRGVFVGSSLQYAPWLEFGTRKMVARPWLSPAVEANREKIVALFGARIAATIKLEGGN